MKASGRIIGSRIVLFAVCFAGAGSAQLPPAAPELELGAAENVVSEGGARDAERVAPGETEGLWKENLEIREQLRKVAALLARERARSDQLKQELNEARRRNEKNRVAGSSARVMALRVLAANGELGFVVLDAGASQGLRAGFTYRLMRDGRAVAQVRVADVREYVSGAVTERIRPGDQPQAGDVAIVGDTGEGSELRPWKYEQ